MFKCLNVYMTTVTNCIDSCVYHSGIVVSCDSDVVRVYTDLGLC